MGFAACLTVIPHQARVRTFSCLPVTEPLHLRSRLLCQSMKVEAVTI
jgi:hypothetical protein